MRETSNTKVTIKCSINFNLIYGIEISYVGHENYIVNVLFYSNHYWSIEMS